MTVFDAPVIWAMLWVLYPGNIEPTPELPAAVPYADCLLVAARVARYWDKRSAWEQPVITCEEVTYGD